MFYKLPEFIRLEQASSPGRGESVDVCVCYPRGGILGGFTSRKIEYVCVCVRVFPTTLEVWSESTEKESTEEKTTTRWFSRTTWSGICVGLTRGEGGWYLSINQFGAPRLTTVMPKRLPRTQHAGAGINISSGDRVDCLRWRPEPRHSQCVMLHVLGSLGEYKHRTWTHTTHTSEKGPKPNPKTKKLCAKFMIPTIHRVGWLWGGGSDKI